MGEVSFIRLKPRQVYTQRDSLLLLREGKRVCKRKGLHHGRNLVIPVLPEPQNVERQIDLRPPENRHHRKSFLHCSKEKRFVPLFIHPFSFFFQINRILNYIQ